MIPAFLARRNHGSFLNDTEFQSRVEPVIVPRSEHNVSRANISPNALKVLYRLKSAGFEAFLVGGGVRDLLLDRHPKDFDVVTDADMGGGARWIEVRPPGAQTSIVLSAASASGKDPGEGAHLTFTADDVAATVAELRSRGATVSDPVSEPWGTYATVDAPDGHRLQFHERRGR